MSGTSGTRDELGFDFNMSSRATSGPRLLLIGTRDELGFDFNRSVPSPPPPVFLMTWRLGLTEHHQGFGMNTG
jgi:hypothetical protein